MIIDAHIHLFSETIIANVAQRPAMVAELRLQAGAAAQRLGPAALEKAMRRAGVALALHLPTAKATAVAKVNDNALSVSREFAFLATAGTLHPAHPDIPRELARLSAAGLRSLKLCSFSQVFQLDGPPALGLWDRIQDFNRNTPHPFCVVLDTYTGAHRHFGSAPEHTTTPQRLAFLAGRFPGIRFVGAHMGGLDAPIEVLVRDLPPAPNLYLDTSNAAHLLSDDAFVQLLKIHGPEKILFGTDWPWFDPGEEIARIERLLVKAGFTKSQREWVFGDNAAALLGI